MENTVKSAAVLRLTGGKMTYSGGQNVERSAVFDGGVTVLGVDGTVRARSATVYLTPAAGGSGSAGVTAGSVERIVATGAVEMVSGERRGRGEKLVYTPSAAGAKQSGEFELTGTKERPPVLMDPVRGSVTGASLRFNSADDSVIISGGAADSGGAAQSDGRARTRLKVER